MTGALIEIRDAAFGYAQRPVVRAESIGIAPGRCLGVFGPNGSGKTTLVRGLTGLLAPISGVVHRARALRIGYLPQHRAMELHWPMSGLDAASLAMSAYRRLGWARGVRNGLLSWLRVLEVESLIDRRFRELSGGQQQRLLLAGTLAIEPHVLVLDEPTDGLDVHSRRLLIEALRQQSARGLAAVLITHDLEDLSQLTDEVAWLHSATEPDEPSRIEMVSPNMIAERIISLRAGAVR